MINSGVAPPLSRPGRSSSFSMVACPDEKQWVLEQAPPPVQERIMASWNEDFLEDFLSSFMGEQSISIPSRPADGCQALEEVPKSPQSFGEIGSNSLEKVSTAGGQTERKRKRRRFYDTKDENGNWLIPHVPLPRIPKSDIRREYAQLFSNVYNSGDNDLLRRFVGQMFPDSHNFRFGYGGKYYELCTGRSVMYQFSREHMSMAPDVVFSFEAARIKLRSDGTSALYGTFKITGNQVFRCPYEEKLALDDHQMSPSFRLIGNHITYTGSDIPSTSTDFPSPANEDTASPAAPSVSAASFTTESSSTDTTLEKDFLFPDATTLLTVPFSSPAFIDQPLPPMPVVSTINVGPHVVDVLPEDFILYPQPKVVDFELNGDFCMSLDAQALIDGMELIVTANLLNKEPVETHASRLSS